MIDLPWACLKLLLGYAGWGPRQLDGEVRAGHWRVADLTPADVFCSLPTSCGALHATLSAALVVLPPLPPP